MSGAADAIRAANDAGRAALIGYLPAGFPTLEASVDAAKILVDTGFDVIEYGQPYSDPCMDGPVIQAAATRALEQGLRTRDVMSAVGRVQEAGGVVMTMTYYALIYAYGVQRYATELAQAGGVGVITPDLPPEEGGEWESAADAAGLERTYLVAPSSSASRLKLIAEHTRGWVYAASTMGVTGVRASVDQSSRELVQRTREAGAGLVCVGFGVGSAADVRKIGAYADGVIVGSALVRALDNPDVSQGLADLKQLASALAQGSPR